MCCLFWLSLAGLSYSETRYVVQDNLNAAPPYTNWATAAATIQDAVDTAVESDTILVTNGVYDTGGRAANWALTNRLIIDKPLVVRSVRGPEVTIIKGNADPQYTNGESAVRCVYLGTNATLIGFTLNDGHTQAYAWPRNLADCLGGGIYCEPSAVLSNCILAGNSASFGGGASGGTLYNCTLNGNSATFGGGGIYLGTLYRCALAGNSAGSGGGAYNSTLYNCALQGNWAYGYFDSGGGGAYFGTLYNCVLTDNLAYNCGGGAFGSTLYNCSLIGNLSDSGGGVFYGKLYNCIVYYNTAPSAPNFSSGTLNSCCTTPKPDGVGNTTNAPLFVNFARGNFRLQSNSPCINTGINQDWMTNSTDLDGNPRIRRSRVDMGAYESDYWGQFSDVDADSFSDWIEVYRTGTDPTNAASYLGMGTPVESDGAGTGIVVRWQSVTGKLYRLVRSTNLIDGFTSLSNHLDATPPMNVYTDKTATGQGPWFYRVGLE
jgi:hypothetical protein